MDARTWNGEVDQQLAATGVVGPELFVRLEEAYGYNAASAVGWVEAKLNVLAKRLCDGRALELFDPVVGSRTTVRDRKEFAAWVERHFPAARLPEL